MTQLELSVSFVFEYHKAANKWMTDLISAYERNMMPPTCNIKSYSRVLSYLLLGRTYICYLQLKGNIFLSNKNFRFIVTKSWTAPRRAVSFKNGLRE